jgi:hypothetical protein
MGTKTRGLRRNIKGFVIDSIVVFCYYLYIYEIFLYTARDVFNGNTL